MNKVINIANELEEKAVWTRFNYTQAKVSDVIADRYILIKSYSTIVGMVDTQENKMYEFGKYSSTTSKQFTQIHNQLFNYCERVFINETNWR